MLSRTWAALALAGALSGQTGRIAYFPVRQEVVEARLARYPDKNRERAARLAELFTEAGCSGERLSQQPVKHTRQPNVICTLTGEAATTIIVGAHSDFSDRGHGVVDNWSGASLLPSLFEAVAKNHSRHTFVFVGFAAEESGLNGSRAFVKNLTADQRRATLAMVNLDSIGLTPTKLWVNGSDRALAAALAKVAQAMQSPLEGVNVEKVGTSDSQSFMEAKIPAVDIHSITQNTLSILHSPRDRLDAIDRAAYYETYRLVTAYLAFLDAGLGPQPREK